jgi:hypothetical protein
MDLYRQKFGTSFLQDLQRSDLPFRGPEKDFSLIIGALCNNVVWSWEPSLQNYQFFKKLVSFSQAYLLQHPDSGQVLSEIVVKWVADLIGHWYPKGFVKGLSFSLSDLELTCSEMVGQALSAETVDLSLFRRRLEAAPKD